MLEYKFNINNGEIVSLGVLQQTHTVAEDGNILSTSNQRWLVYPLDINPTDSQEVQDKMDEVFTDEVKVKYQEYLDSLKPTDEETIRSEYESKLAKINANYVNSINELSRGVPDTERSTWSKQEQEAREYLAGNTEVLMLSALAKARGLPLDYLVSKVVEKANVYSIIVGELTGNRQREEDALKIEYKDIL